MNNLKDLNELKYYMKRILTLLCAALMTVGFAACNKTLLDDTHHFANEKWMRFTPEKYSFEVSNIDDCYDILLTLRIDTTRYSANELPLIIDLYTANDEHRQFSAEAKLHDRNGTLNGTRMGQYVDITIPAKRFFYFNSSGTQRLEIKQATSRYEIDGINRLTVEVKKSDMRLKE